jgi:hypothetical protein
LTNQGLSYAAGVLFYLTLGVGFIALFAFIVACLVGPA